MGLRACQALSLRALRLPSGVASVGEAMLLKPINY
jgi:hypothetical protein